MNQVYSCHVCRIHRFESVGLCIVQEVPKHSEETVRLPTTNPQLERRWMIERPIPRERFTRPQARTIFSSASKRCSKDNTSERYKHRKQHSDSRHKHRRRHSNKSTRRLSQCRLASKCLSKRYVHSAPRCPTLEAPLHPDSHTHCHCKKTRKNNHQSYRTYHTDRNAQPCDRMPA